MPLLFLFSFGPTVFLSVFLLVLSLHRGYLPITSYSNPVHSLNCRGRNGNHRKRKFAVAQTPGGKQEEESRRRPGDRCQEKGEKDSRTAECGRRRRPRSAFHRSTSLPVPPQPALGIRGLSSRGGTPQQRAPRLPESSPKARAAVRPGIPECGPPYSVGRGSRCSSPCLVAAAVGLGGPAANTPRQPWPPFRRGRPRLRFWD